MQLNKMYKFNISWLCTRLLYKLYHTQLNKHGGCGSHKKVVQGYVEAVSNLGLMVS